MSLSKQKVQRHYPLNQFDRLLLEEASVVIMRKLNCLNISSCDCSEAATFSPFYSSSLLSFYMELSLVSLRYVSVPQPFKVSRFDKGGLKSSCSSIYMLNEA